MNHTDIEYLDYTWNPTKGCNHGCNYCFAREWSKRMAAMKVPGYDRDDPFAVHCYPERLKQPLKKKKPSRIGVSFMGDLFDPKVTDYFIDKVLSTIFYAKQHRFLILTKQPERMYHHMGFLTDGDNSVLPNLALGVSCDNQVQVDERVPILLGTPAAIRFLSLEPLMDDVDISRYTRPAYDCIHIDEDDGTCGHPDSLTPECFNGSDCPTYGSNYNGLDWVIVGAESPQQGRVDTYASYNNLDWTTNIVRQCQETNIPIFVKQISRSFKTKPVTNVNDFPPSLQVREYPEALTFKGGN